jgi:UDP-glucose 4-epimerase
MANRYHTACVTGGAGFIGSHLVRALLARGMQVRVLDDLSVGKAENVPREATLIRGDILDPKVTARAVVGCDVVFHLAARVAIRASFDHVVEDTTCNVAGTASVLRAAGDSSTVRKFITASSMAVYSDGPGPVPIAESYRAEPVSPYGISKLAAERLTHCLCAAKGVDSVVLRLFNTYGPGQAFSPYVGVVTIFVNRMLKGEEPDIFGDGEQCRDFVHVQDVAGAFVQAMDAEVTGETFNVGTGIPVSVNSVFHSVRQAMGLSLAARYVPAVPGELRYSVADIGRAQKALGYEPTHSFDSSVGQVVEEILSAAETRV